MHRFALPLTVLGLVAFAGVGTAHAEKKVTICHHPPGDPNSTQTVSVGESATAAHLKHGDELGPCASGCQANAALCDDGNACTSDVCLTSGECAHNPVNCDDGNVCTNDACQETTGCLSLPANGVSCDDGNSCTSNDTCSEGACAGTPGAGCCATAAECDDGNACTDDACVGNSCSNEPRDCTVADKCLAGFCDPLTGQCDIAPVNCSDSNVCTDDICDPSIGCYSCPTLNPPEPQEASCADGADNDCDGLVDSTDPDCAEECGNGVAVAPEQCDGSDLLGATCDSVLPCPPGAVCDPAQGSLSCTAICTLNTTGCRRCGNGVREATEQCDGTDLGGATCQSLGFYIGSLGCKAPGSQGSCTFDFSGCSGSFCGDGICDYGFEDCNFCFSDCGPICEPL
jgi:hypothetical protein